MAAMLRNFVLLATVIIGLVLGACCGGVAEIGILQGNVTIGPICPVERPGEPCPVPCEAYQARKVMIYNNDGTKLVEQVDIDCTGHYLVELHVGEYTVDINYLGIDSSKDVPTKIEIQARQTIEVNISIDTGIR
jgi:hypothetical protein